MSDVGNGLTASLTWNDLREMSVGTYLHGVRNRFQVYQAKITRQTPRSLELSVVDSYCDETIRATMRLVPPTLYRTEREAWVCTRHRIVQELQHVGRLLCQYNAKLEIADNKLQELSEAMSEKDGSQSS